MCIRDSLYGDIQVLEAEINDYNEKLTDEDTLEDYSDLKYAFEKAQEKLEETDASSVAAYTANYSSFQNAKTAFEELDDRLQGLSLIHILINSGKIVPHRKPSSRSSQITGSRCHGT